MINQMSLFMRETWLNHRIYIHAIPASSKICLCATCAHCVPHSYGLRHAATRCNTLQHAATHLLSLFLEAGWNLLCWKEKMWSNMLQCTATHCNTLAVSISRGGLQLSTYLLWEEKVSSCSELRYCYQSNLCMKLQQLLCDVAAISVCSCSELRYFYQSTFCVKLQHLLCEVAETTVRNCSNYCTKLQQLLCGVAATSVWNFSELRYKAEVALIEIGSSQQLHTALVAD